MASSKTEAECQGGSCGSTSSSPVQKQWKTGTKQNLENYFFQIRSCGAETLTPVLAAVLVQALSLSPHHRGRSGVGTGALCNSGGSSRVAASSSSVLAPMATTVVMPALSWCPAAVQSNLHWQSGTHHSMSKMAPLLFLPVVFFPSRPHPSGGDLGGMEYTAPKAPSSCPCTQDRVLSLRILTYQQGCNYQQGCKGTVRSKHF